MKPEAIATLGTASYSAAFALRFPETPATAEEPRRVGPWTCQACGLMNPSGAPHCDCGSHLHQNNEHVAVLQASRPRPWIRYWARSLDLVLAGAAFAIAAGSVGVEVTQWNSFVFGWLVVMLWIPFEAAFLSSCGTTPGKWLFNVRLSKPDRSYLTFQQALGRGTAVLIKGQGFGIPIISFFTQIAAWGTLNKRGIASWDGQYGVVVRHDAIGAGRILGIVLTVLVLLVLVGMGNTMNDPTGLSVASY